jgi:hypothetical protein
MYPARKQTISASWAFLPTFLINMQSLVPVFFKDFRFVRCSILGFSHRGMEFVPTVMSALLDPGLHTTRKTAINSVKNFSVSKKFTGEKEY